MSESNITFPLPFRPRIPSLSDTDPHFIEFAIDENEKWGYKKDDGEDVTPFYDQNATVYPNDELNMNKWIIPGTYVYGPSSTNRATKAAVYGVVKVYGYNCETPSSSMQWIYQELIDNDGRIFTRNSINPNSTSPNNWKPWKQMNGMENGHSIEFGVDENGRWGYKKDGADTVIPFSDHSTAIYALASGVGAYATYKFTKDYICVVALMCQLDSDNNGDNRAKLWMNRSDNPSDWNDMTNAWTKQDLLGSSVGYSTNQGSIWSNANDKNKTRAYQYPGASIWTHTTCAYYLNVKSGDTAKIRSSHGTITWFIGIE